MVTLKVRFPKDDIKKLRTYLEKLPDIEYLSPDIDRTITLCEFYDYDADQMVSDSPMLLSLLHKDLDEMPLYINAEIEIDYYIAKWRLEIGK